MADPTRYPSRLRVALLEPEPIRVEGFVTIFQDHPRIEFVVFELAAFLADQEFKLALIGLHGDKLPLPLVGTIHGLRPDVRLIVMGPNADDEVILQAISSGAKAYLEANATPEQVEQARKWDMLGLSLDALSKAIMERENVVDTIGNLSLLTFRLNSSVSNGPFEDKRNAILQQSALRLNRYFQTIGAWDEGA